MIKHESERQNKCTECGKSFFMKGDLLKHKEVHKNILWECNLCTYETLDKRNLKAHQRKHSNLRPYLCTYCLMLFKYPEQLKRHQRKPCNESLVMEKDVIEGPESETDLKQRRRSDSPEF